MWDICSKERPVNNLEEHETAQGGAEMLCWEDHPSGYPIRFPAASWVRVGEAHSWLRCKPEPKLGELTREILRELGYSADVIEELIALKVANTYQPELGSEDVFSISHYLI